MKIASNEVIHFVGIGGIGMSGLAQIMHNMGFMVQGSDLSQSKNVDRLRKFGIKIFIGHKKKNIKKVTMLVIFIFSKLIFLFLFLFLKGCLYYHF